MPISVYYITAAVVLMITYEFFVIKDKGDM